MWLVARWEVEERLLLCGGVWTTTRNEDLFLFFLCVRLCE